MKNFEPIIATSHLTGISFANQSPLNHMAPALGARSLITHTQQGELKPRDLFALIIPHLPAIEEPAEYHTPDEIAALVELGRRSIYHYLNQLWPNHSGEWRLKRTEAEQLIMRVCRAGHRIESTVKAKYLPSEN